MPKQHYPEQSWRELLLSLRWDLQQGYRVPLIA